MSLRGTRLYFLDEVTYKHSHCMLSIFELKFILFVFAMGGLEKWLSGEEQCYRPWVVPNTHMEAQNPVPGNPTPSSDLHRQQYMQDAQTYSNTLHIEVK